MPVLVFGLGVWVASQYIPDALALGDAMVKEPKFFRKQAAKAERMARAVSDTEISQSFLNMAKAYRSQADALKAKKEWPSLNLRVAYFGQYPVCGAVRI